MKSFFIIFTGSFFQFAIFIYHHINDFTQMERKDKEFMHFLNER